MNWQRQQRSAVKTVNSFWYITAPSNPNIISHWCRICIQSICIIINLCEYEKFYMIILHIFYVTENGRECTQMICTCYVIVYVEFKNVPRQEVSCVTQSWSNLLNNCLIEVNPLILQFYKSHFVVVNANKVEIVRIIKSITFIEQLGWIAF